jgi:hypothetical protein
MTTVNSHGRSDISAIYRTSVSEIPCFLFPIFDRALEEAAVPWFSIPILPCKFRDTGRGSTYSVLMRSWHITDTTMSYADRSFLRLGSRLKV